MSAEMLRWHTCPGCNLTFIGYRMSQRIHDHINTCAPLREMLADTFAR